MKTLVKFARKGCSYLYHLMLAAKGDTICGVCGEELPIIRGNAQ